MMVVANVMMDAEIVNIILTLDSDVLNIAQCKAGMLLEDINKQIGPQHEMYSSKKINRFYTETKYKTGKSGGWNTYIYSVFDSDKTNCHLLKICVPNNKDVIINLFEYIF
jgi:hypothetical protein